MKRIVGISGQLGSGKDTAADRLISKFGFTKVALADPIKRYGLKVFNFTEDQLWGPSELRNAHDTRFQWVDSADTGDDAWMAAFHRAAKHNREFVKELFPESPILQGQAFSALESWLLKLSEEHPKLSPRVMLQSLGTEWGRVLNDNVWINHTIKLSESLLEGAYSYDRCLGLVESQADAPEGVVISDIRFENELSSIKHAQGFLLRIHRSATDDQAVRTGIKGHASEAEQREFKDGQFNYVIHNDSELEKFLEAVDVAGFILTGGSE